MRGTSKEETTQYIKGLVNGKPEEVILLLKSYLPTTWTSESKSNKGDFGKNAYESIESVTDTDFLYETLAQEYGEPPGDLEYPKMKPDGADNIPKMLID